MTFCVKDSKVDVDVIVVKVFVKNVLTKQLIGEPVRLHNVQNCDNFYIVIKYFLDV